jgi:hypothetical protein
LKLSDLTSPAAVEQAIAEFDLEGREAFLAKYKFGKSTAYFVRQDGKLYDSKALAAAALTKQFPNIAPLRNSDFRGGEPTVAAKFRDLGFSVTAGGGDPVGRTRLPSDLHPGQVLLNADLKAVFQCGQSGGMRRSLATNTLMLVSDSTKGLYIDEWRDGVLHYCGMGQIGDQALDFAQNKTLAESGSN